MARSVGVVVALVLGVLVPACSSEPGEMHTGMSSAAASYDSLCSTGDDGPSAVVRQRAERAFARYAELHHAILDPKVTNVEKKFLVLQPLLGMGNSQIEEVTALLIAMETKRALLIGLFDRSVGDEGHLPANLRKAWFAPFTEAYDRVINLRDDQLAHFVPNNFQAGLLPERREHMYAQFNEFVACGDWRNDLKDAVVGTPGRFLGYIPAYLNEGINPPTPSRVSEEHEFSEVVTPVGEGAMPTKKRGKRQKKKSHLDAGEGIMANFGAHFFGLASNFLHAPSLAVKSVVAAEANRSGLLGANCSVGLHIRWGNPTDRFFYVDHKRPFQSLAKYLDCAKMLCPCARDDPAAGGTVWLLATDSAWVRSQVTEAASFLHASLRVWHGHAPVHADNRNHEQALADMLLVGNAQHLITTRLSTFSFAMHARAYKRPWVVSQHLPVCTRALHSQDGLFIGGQVHEGWPWRVEQMERVSCSQKLNMSRIHLAPPACSPLCPV